MVLEHVAQYADAVIKTGTVFQADFFRYGDLNMVDVVAIPNRLEDSIGKAGEENVLYGFFAEIMVNAIDLVFV